VVVPDEQLSLAIGRRGQNVRLASQLTGLDIDIMTEAEESERRQAEFAERTQLFMDTLDVDEMMAQLLVAEGFTDAGGSRLCRARRAAVDRRLRRGHRRGAAGPRPRQAGRDQPKALENARALGVEDSLIAFEGLTPQMVEALAKDGVKTLEDFATCADWELAGGWTDGRRQARQGRRPAGEVRREPGRGAAPGHDRAGHAGLGRSADLGGGRRDGRKAEDEGAEEEAPDPGARHDAGRTAKDRDDPERRCIATGERGPKAG
jgi:transcription termination/antitermination protein NusA